MKHSFCFSAFLLITTAISLPAYADFNPQDGADAAQAESAAARTRLPSTTALTDYGKPRKSMFPNVLPAAAASASPTTVSTAATAAPVTFSPMDGKISSTAAVPTHPPAIPPLQPVATAGFPRMDAQTLQAGGFVAPAPLISQPMAAPAPVVTLPAVPQDSVKPVLVPAAPAAVAVAPVTAAPEPVAAPLSRETKSILSRVPSKIDAAKPTKGGKVNVARITPEMHDLQVKGKVDEYEASGIKISVRRPGLDTNFELNRAYNALQTGDSETAIGIYKNILSTEPTNQDALFGLATLYHRQGQLEKARGYYSTLLKNYPNNREGLNNFLVLVSDESPQEALAELTRLEQRNPDFSPIPAQEAMLLHKQGFLLEARDKMLRAIELAPNNLTYKYNLAIMLDGQGNAAEAANLYRMLVDAGQRGETLPAPIETIQKRLNYIATTMTAAQYTGN